MKDEITNGADMIDSRDVIARISELQDELTGAHEGEGTAVPYDDWLEAMAENDAGTLQDAARELLNLNALAGQCEGYGDWNYGEQLIRYSYFEEYARDLADDIGAVNKDATWPNTFIDWEAAADALKQDYREVDFDGVTYFMRG